MASLDPKGKVALVTGSTSGIGLVIAHSLAKRGVNIIVTGLGDQALRDKILEEIRSHGVRADFVSGDLSKPADIASLWSQVLRIYSDGVDILINNAGVPHLGEIERVSDDIWDWIVAINLSAPFHLTKHCLPGMKKKGWGRIVNMSSTLGVVGDAHCTPYTTTKHGLTGLTKGVALENAQYGITCNTVNPTFTETSMAGIYFEQKASSTGKSASEIENEMLSFTPTGKFNTPQQVAELVEFLCLSSASSQMTGASYLIDGGVTAQ